MTLGLRHADARDQRRCKLVNHLPILRSDQTSVRLPFRLTQPITIRSRFVRLLVSFKKNGARAFRVLAPTLVALSFAGVAHAQGTMDFSGAQTLMTTFNWRNDYVAVEQWSRNIVRDNYVYLFELYEQHIRFAKTWDIRSRPPWR
jgi:hypothetical protein